jgi:ABC-type phosphate/phosphonate transport system ATPase subunit
MKKNDVLVEEMRHAQKETEWLSEHYSQLKKDYPRKFVAIKNQQVVFVEGKLETLLKKLKAKFGDTNGFFIEFLPDENYVLVV